MVCTMGAEERTVMRIGISLVDHNTPDALDRLEADIRAAADDGFTSAWLSNIFGMDALTALAVAGRRVPGIELGTAVVPTYPRHPAALAQQALTAAAALDGRLILGIGTSHRVVVEDMYGYDMSQPIRHMREYLSVLLPLLDRQPVSFAGATVRANVGLSAPAPGRVPLVMAALGPQMLRLAGQQADGTVLWMTGPATVRDHIVPTLTEAASQAGRPAPRVVCVLPVYVTENADAARDRAARVFQIYGDLPSYRAMLDREGAAGPADVALVGDEDAVAAQVRVLEEAGVTDFVAGVYAPKDDQARTRALLRSLMG
jgi:F420-dependent oxidoreductase-like protein